MLRQLIAALASVELILATVGLRRFLEDLASDLTEVTVGIDRGVGRQLRPVDRDHTDRRQSGPRTQVPSTPEDTSPSASSCQPRKSAIVE